MTRPSCSDCRFGAWRDDASNRDGNILGKLRERESGRGIASNDDGLGVLVEQHSGDFQAISLDGGGAFAAVGDAGGIAEVKN